MAVDHSHTYSKLIRAALCTLILFHGFCVDGAVEREIECISEQLRQPAQSSFYLLGYCSSPASPECTSLMSLLESIETLTRDSLIKTGLLVYDLMHWPTYWRQRHLDASTPVHLWFACHDGQQTRIEPTNNTYIDVSPDDVSASSAIASAASTYASAVCSPDVPFYACPQLPTLVQVDVLMNNLAAAMKQHGAACMEGQMRSWHPAAAAAAAAPAADPKNLGQAFLHSLDSFLEDQQMERLIWRFFFILLAAGGALLIFAGLDIKHMDDNSPLNNAYRWSIVGATVAVAGAIKLGTDMFLWLLGAGLQPTSWWWAVAAWIAMVGSVAVWFIDHDRQYADYIRKKAAREQATAAKASTTVSVSPAAPTGSSSGTETATNQCSAAHQGADPQRPGAAAQQATATPAGTSTAAAEPPNGSSSKAEAALQLSTSGGTSVGSAAASGVAAAAVITSCSGDGATPAAAAAAAASSDLSEVSSMSEVDCLRLEIAQLTELVKQLHKESGDNRAATAAAATAAAANQGADIKEALACLQARLDSVESRLREVSNPATSTVAAATSSAAAADPEHHDGTTQDIPVTDAANISSGNDADEVSSDSWQQVEAVQ